MARIYVSSTFSDLKEYREQVRTALRSMDHEDIAMEYYSATDERPIDKCLSDVESCELYIGVFAWRYGFIPPGSELSITELEYRKAVECGKECLIFLLSEDASWPRSKMDRASDRIDALRKELSNGYIAGIFTNPDDLRAKVFQAVRNWEVNSGRAGKEKLTDWDAYRQAVINKHQWVRLQVIAGTSKDRGIAKIPLIDVFEPQLIVTGAPGSDVPEEVRKYQEEIYGPRPLAPNETTPEETEDANDTEETVETETEESLLARDHELVLEMLGREPTQVILGGPGSGKSTILHYAMLMVCQANVARDMLPLHLQDAPIPFLVELRNYMLQKAPDFVSYIVQNIKEFYDAIIEAASLITLFGQEGKALVFFDGLDEVFNPAERRQMLDQFQTFAHRYPQTRVVVTSRIAGYNRTALGTAGFEHYTLLPLTLGQIRHFANQWYQFYTLEGTERTAQGLVQRIIENPRLLDLAGNPLLLTMMAVIYKDRDLPNERWRLYQRCAETLLEDWELGKGIEVKDFKLTVLVRTAQKAEILQRVSMYMLEHSQSDRELNAIAYAPLLDIIASYLEEKYQRSRGDAEAIAVDILHHLMEHTYVLAGIGEGIFGFVHRTFMEYFAACYCQAQFNARKSNFAWLTRKIFGAHWQGGEWEEVLLLLIAMLHDQGTPIREVVEYLRSKRSKRQAAVPLNIAFAARCLGEAGDMQDPTQGQALLVELAQAIEEYSLQGRKVKARAFVEAALKAFATLAPLVAAPSAAVQKTIDRLNLDGAVTTRIDAWQMGFALRSRQERLEYALAALKDKEVIVRLGAIAVLEREWPGRADLGPVLAEVVHSDRQAQVRQAALATMQRSWRSESAILDVITELVDQETSYHFVIRLIEFLTKTWPGNSRACDLVMGLTGPKLKARDDYSYTNVVVVAAKALAQGWAGDDRALTFLQEHATNAPDVEVCSAAIQAIADGWREDVQALAFLRERAIKAEPKTRIAVFHALTQTTFREAWAWDSREVRPHGLIAETASTLLRDRAINDPDAEVRTSALQCLARDWQGDAQAQTFLKNQVTSALDPKARIAALQALTAAETQYRGFFRYEPWEFTAQTENSLALLLRDRAENDPDGEVRTEAIELIGSLMDERMLMEAEMERIMWGRPRTDTTKIDMLAFLQALASNDPEAKTRLAGLRAIGRGWGGEAQALAFLQDRAANDPADENRSAVREMLEDLTRETRRRFN